MIISPKRRTLLSRVTTRTPSIGLGRAPGTSLHSPSEGWYSRGSELWLWERTPSDQQNLKQNILIVILTIVESRIVRDVLRHIFCYNSKLHIYFTLSFSLERKLAHPWPYRPVISPELKSSLQPSLPYRDTVVKDLKPPVTSTVSVSGSGMEHAPL